MSRSNVSCGMGHTALFPGKDETRTTGFEHAPKTTDLITISHGALGVLSTMRWQGPIHVCDIDPGVCERMRYIIEDRIYPRLNLQPVAHCRGALPTVTHWCENRNRYRRLGIVDLDLTATIDKVWDDVCRDVIRALRFYNVHTKVLLTFRNGRDCFGKNAIETRIAWLESQLPARVKVIGQHCYRSDWIGRFATGEIGSSMCMAVIQT